MARESSQNLLFIQIDASSFAEFEISELEIARVDCTGLVGESRGFQLGRSIMSGGKHGWKLQK